MPTILRWKCALLCRGWGDYVVLESAQSLVQCLVDEPPLKWCLCLHTTEAKPSEVWLVLSIISRRLSTMVYPCSPRLTILRCIERYTIPWPNSVVPFVHPDRFVNLRLCIHGWCFATLRESHLVVLLKRAAESTHPSIHLFQVHNWSECRHRHRGSTILIHVSPLPLYAQIPTRQRHIHHLWHEAR